MRHAVHTRAVLSSAGAAFAAAALCAAPASAQDTGSADCPVAPTVQAFAPWQDTAEYFLAPDGDIEAGAAAWTLLDGAAAVEGNAPFGLGAATDHRSLQLPSGSSATTASMCIAVEHRTIRFVAKGAASSRLVVSAVGTRADGKERSVRLETIDGTDTWAPSPVVEMRVDDLADRFGSTSSVALQFAPKGDGAWQIDDVYVDPYRSN